MEAPIPSQIIGSENQTTTPPPEAEIPASAPASLPVAPATSGHLRLPTLTSFLVLAPVQSAAYTTQAATEAAPSLIESQNTQSETVVPAPEDTIRVQEEPAALKQRRSSSVGSDSAQNRYLRLGPSFGGEKFDDFAAVEE